MIKPKTRKMIKKYSIINTIFFSFTPFNISNA